VSEPASALEPADLAAPPTPRERAAYLMYAAVERAAMALPESWGRRAFHLAGTAAYHLVPGARRVVRANLRRVLGRAATPEALDAATKEAFTSYARYWFDAFRARVIPVEGMLARVRVEGDEHLAAAMEAGRGAIVALPHLGNWDVAGKWVACKGWSITAVAELLRPEPLFRLFLDHRRALGMNIVPLYDDRGVGQELVRLLSENEVIALVADRDLKGKGVRVEMFGEERMIPAGPALLSLASSAPLMACQVYDEADGWMIHIGAPLEVERTESLRADVETMTRKLAAEFERGISAAPTQWHMFQPAWPEDGGAAPGRPPVGAGEA
jgi:phosphatidylinositol dimannoside acyltransferase